MINGDPRICHYGNKNNKQLGIIILKLMIEKKYNITLNMMSDYVWNQYDESNDILFDRTIKEMYNK